ncbi:MAG: hypothetical protein ABI823_16330 [Bryobacteraceae bacterium]
MLRAFLMFSTAVSFAFGQLSSSAIEGEVFDVNGRPATNLTIALCRNDACEEQTPVYEGRFRFIASASRGSYSLRVMSDEGTLLYSQPVYLENSQMPLHITLPASVEIGTSKPGGNVSIQQLSHRPSKAASRELHRALSSFQHNKPAEGTAHLEKALVADPAYAAAHYLLGLTLQQNGYNDEALKHLEDAANAFPKAHIFAAKILAKSGKEEMAIGHLRKYLQSGDPTYRDKAVFALRESGAAE